MIHIYTQPTLWDFIRVVCQMPQNERDNFEALTGEKYNVDSIAVGNFTVLGPKWVIKADDEPICIGGFVPQRPGVWRDFMINTPAAWEKHWFPVTRICRRAMTAMFASKQAHRLECVSLAARDARIFRWYETLGYNLEATLYGYCASGADALLFSKVRH
jgi:hypothetical protein